MLNWAEARYLVEDVPAIPLYATPRFLVHSAKLTGPKLNPTGHGPFWNVGAWAWAPS
jgi:hypothetical protein